MSSSHMRCPRDVHVARLLTVLARELMCTTTSAAAQLQSSSRSPRKASLVNAPLIFTQSTLIAQLERNTSAILLPVSLRLSRSLPQVCLHFPSLSMNMSTLQLLRFLRPLHRCMNITIPQSLRFRRPLRQSTRTRGSLRLLRLLHQCMSIITQPLWIQSCRFLPQLTKFPLCGRLTRSQLPNADPRLPSALLIPLLLLLLPTLCLPRSVLRHLRSPQLFLRSPRSFPQVQFPPFGSTLRLLSPPSPILPHLLRAPSWCPSA